MVTARDLVREAFIANPKLKELNPEGVVKAVNGNVETQIKNFYNGQQLHAKPKIDYLKSNLRGNYFVILCDICSARCRKAYVKKVVINNIPEAKVLCGKCARIKYKRKTETEKRALYYAIHPEKMTYALKTNNLKDCIVALEAFDIRRQIQERAEKLTKKFIGELPPEIIE